MLLNVFGFVGDHPNERVELNDCHTEVDDVHWTSKETLQSRHKFCIETFKSMTVTFITPLCIYLWTNSHHYYRIDRNEYFFFLIFDDVMGKSSGNHTKDRSEHL